MRQRHFLVFVSGLLLSACASKDRVGEDVQIAAVYRADADSKALEALEPPLVSHGRAYRTSDVLTLPVQIGPSVRLENKSSCEDATEAHCIFYSLVADLPSRHAYLVAINFYEGGDYLWIDDRSGRSTSIPAPPHFGPEPDLFVTLDNDVEFGNHDIEIWKRSEDAFSMIYSHEVHEDCNMTFQSWDASGIHIEMDAYSEHPDRRWRSDVIIKNGEWRYSERLPPAVVRQ